MQAQVVRVRAPRAPDGAVCSSARRARARVAAPRSPGVRCAATSRRDHLPSEWVERCLERAQRTAVLVNDIPFIPLAEAQRWFEAGVHAEDEKLLAEIDGSRAERARLRQEMDLMAENALKDHDVQDQKLRRLLNYAVALEKEVEKARAGMEEAALQAAHEAEERTLLQYQAMLMQYEQAHEAEQHLHAASLQAEVTRLHGLLHAAHGAKKQWRERALEVERQFMELRALIETSLRQSASSASAASSSFRTQQAGEQAPPPLHANPRIRPTEEVAPADADVAVLHSADMTAGKGPKGLNGGAKAGKVRHRRGSVDPRSSSESLHSL